MIHRLHKKILLVITVLILLFMAATLGVDYWYMGTLTNVQERDVKIFEDVEEQSEVLSESATQGVLPSIQTNPLEDKPNINPADKANPFTHIETNPFK